MTSKAVSDTLDALNKLEAGEFGHIYREQIDGALLNRGFSLLGRGAYGSVYSNRNDPNRVVKVAQHDRAWLAYMRSEWVQFSDKHAPRCYGLADQGGFTVAEMERLTPLPIPMQQKFGGKLGMHPGIAAITAGFSVDFAVFSDNLKAWGLEQGFCTDFHGGNIMMRGDVPVWTDPFCG